MTKTDSPVRAHSEMSNEGYKAFTKDKRTRTVRSNSDAIYTSSRREGSEGEHFEKRRSYNPNFTRDNQLTERNRRQGEFRSERTYENREGGFRRERNFGENSERNFNREERPYNRERNFNREERSERSFNREGGFRRERTFGERTERPERSFNRERNFNREERTERTFNREGGFRRERNFGENSERPERSFNRERNFNREERSERTFNREGGFRRERNFGENSERTERSFNRERNFNREERSERSFNREGGFGNKPRFNKGGFGKPSFRSGDRKPFSAERQPKTYVNTANHYTLENYPSYDTPKQDGEIRLNRYIAMSGICSRREADDYITSGAITVNGVVVTELGTKVMPNDEVCYNGEKIQNEKKVYIVMNKPKGFVTTLDDPHADKSVMELVKNACTERIYPVGRLDKNSVGVLLLTNDGDLAKKLTHPTYEKKKIYQVSLDKHLTRADMEQLILGITLEDGDIAADDICYVDDPKMKNAVGIEIHSGRNRIVRRMFEHVGYHVGKLDRVYFAGLTKQKLKRGEWRFLTEKEVAMLKSGSYE